MRILVTGSNGQLGTCMKNADRSSDDIYFFTDIEDLDICDYESLNKFIDDNGIELIINCAAYTNVDKAEEPDEFEKVKAINSDAVKNMALISKDKNITLIHISTDYVFGGNINNEPCTETQPTNPTGVYGMTKLMAEEAIKSSGANYLIFRTSWLYSEYGRNFVKTMSKLIEEKDKIKVVFDQVGTPTYAQDLADAIVDIVNNRKFESCSGIFNYSNQGVCSWYDFAKMIQALEGNKSCIIEPCHSSEFPSKVKRPAYSVLDKTKYETTFKRSVPYWIVSLAQCIENLRVK